MLKRPSFILTIAVLLVALALASLPGRATARLKGTLGAIFLPLFGLAGASHNLSQKTADTVVSKSALLAEAAELRQENQRLRILAAQGEECLRENTRLRQFLGAPKPAASKMKFARVVGRDPANWWRSVQIDLGTRDGVSPNLTVLTPEGLVGRISEVGSSHSQVLLVGDPSCRVAARILESHDNTGVIVPNPSDPSDNTIVDLTFLSRNSALKPGQSVLTSGQGGVFPPGIVIGKILDYRMVEFGLYAEARVKLAVNFNALEEVWVMLP